MPVARRRHARQVAIQMLFQRDLNPDILAKATREMIDEQISDDATRNFAWQLFAGVMEFQTMLDEKLEAAAENWSLSRMAPTDRTALRLAAFELLKMDTPPRVVLDEAIELARKFGGEQSHQFVNGILDRLLQEEAHPDEAKSNEIAPSES
jgi:N utilization substance protein B